MILALVRPSRDFSAITENATVDGVLNLVGQRQHDRHACRAANGFWRHWWRLIEALCITLCRISLDDALRDSTGNKPNSYSDWQPSGPQAGPSVKTAAAVARSVQA